jgi:hypothetical protein
MQKKINEYCVVKIKGKFNMSAVFYDTYEIRLI